MYRDYLYLYNNKRLYGGEKFCRKKNTPVGWARRLAERVLRTIKDSGCDVSQPKFSRGDFRRGAAPRSMVVGVWCSRIGDGTGA